MSNTSLAIILLVALALASLWNVFITTTKGYLIETFSTLSA